MEKISDKDGDGIPDDEDPDDEGNGDKDGDGVPDDVDEFPEDPNRC